MSEHPEAVTMKGAPKTLIGDLVRVGEAPPLVHLVANDLSEKTFADYQGKIVVVCSVPSLDTPVCDLEMQRFNKEAASLGENVAVLCVSLDLPFAQKRWCGAHGENIETLSDYKHHNFGERTGLLIKELGLLARCVFVIDKEGKVSYVQLVKEVAEEPNYDEVLEHVKSLS